MLHRFLGREGLASVAETCLDNAAYLAAQLPEMGVELVASPELAVVTFRTDEPGARVKIDDNDAGVTPVTVALGPGPHVVQIIAPDGRITEQQLDVKPGRPIIMNIPLPKGTGGPATLGVTSDPPGARVFVDGGAAGVTPYSVELTPGAHAVAVELGGRLRQEKQIAARQGRDVQLAFVLPAMPKDPALTVDSEPGGATVLIDGKERGRTPFISPVAPGKHELVLRLPGRRDLATEFAMPADKDLSLRLDLLRASGAPRLTVSSAPDGATVLLDGADQGLTPWNGEVKLGDHTVQVVRTGYLSAVRSVKMQSNRDADLSFSLERIPGPRTVSASPPVRLRIRGSCSPATTTSKSRASGTAPSPSRSRWYPGSRSRYASPFRRPGEAMRLPSWA